MTYELYYSPGACSLAAHIILEEIGVRFDLRLVSTANGDTAREPYLSINPKGRVPALRIPGEQKILTELLAILLYLARSYPDHGLIPTGNPLLEARCVEWLAWLAGWVHGVGYALVWRPGRFDSDPIRYEAMAARGRQIIEAAYLDIEKAFADGRAWGLGDRLSIVDPFFLVLYRWGNRIGLSMRDHYPNWAAVSQRMAERPAVQRALQREGISIHS